MNTSKQNNIAAEFFNSASKYSETIALYFPRKRLFFGGNYSSAAFAEIANLTLFYACEFRKSGVRRGDKSLVMLRYSPEFIAVVFGLFSVGAVPVLIDPGMGFSRLLHCISKTVPKVLVGIPQAHWARFFLKKYFKYVKISFST